MTTLIALVRGINVGGKTLKMEMLREICASLGWKNVRTYIQSGNVVFEESRTNVPSLERELESAILGRAGLTVSVIALPAKELQDIALANPFLSEAGIDETKLHLTLLDSAPEVDPAAVLLPKASTADRYLVLGRAVYLHCPDGYGRTEFSNPFIERKLKRKATTRNWNTVKKLLEMASETTD